MPECRVKSAAAAEAGLIISLAGSAAPAGSCFGGAVCGWFSGGMALTVRNAAKPAWRIVSAPADFAVTIRAFIRDLAVCCRRVERRTLRMRLKPQAVVLTAILRMRC